MTSRYGFLSQKHYALKPTLCDENELCMRFMVNQICSMAKPFWSSDVFVLQLACIISKSLAFALCACVTSFHGEL